MNVDNKSAYYAVSIVKYTINLEVNQGIQIS